MGQMQYVNQQQPQIITTQQYQPNLPTNQQVYSQSLQQINLNQSQTPYNPLNTLIYSFQASSPQPQRTNIPSEYSRSA